MLLSLVRRKSEASNRFIKEGKNSITKSRLYKKIFQIADIYISSRPGITNTSRAFYKSLFKAK